MINFLKFGLFEFSSLIPVSFSLVEAPLKILFWYGVKFRNCIYFNILNVIKWLRFIFKFCYPKLDLISIEGAALAQLCVPQKTFRSKMIKTAYCFSQLTLTRPWHYRLFFLWLQIFKSNNEYTGCCECACMHIGIAYMYVHAWGGYCIYTSVCGHGYGCVCVCVCVCCRIKRMG